MICKNELLDNDKIKHPVYITFKLNFTVKFNLFYCAYMILKTEGKIVEIPNICVMLETIH